jgi:CheY-like chemotaxis protein
LNLNSDKVPPSTSLSPAENGSDIGSAKKQAWIVIVEDNPADVGLVREALVKHSVRCSLTVLTDGERAFQLIDKIERERTPCPDLVLLDLKLPKLGGFEVLERVRASSWCSQVPVVVLSSSDEQQDKDRAAELGATRYVRKGSRLEEFMGIGAVVNEILSGG